MLTDQAITTIRSDVSENLAVGTLALNQLMNGLLRLQLPPEPSPAAVRTIAAAAQQNLELYIGAMADVMHSLAVAVEQN